MVLTVLAASYSVGAHAERGSVAWVAAAVFTMLVGMAIAEPSDLIFPALFFAFLPWLGGRLLRSHRALTRELARETVRAEEARARRPRPRDRTRAGRIARELHDVLAHNLSRSSSRPAPRGSWRPTRSRAARRARDRDTGREAIDEMRRLLGRAAPRRRGAGARAAAGPRAARRARASARAAGVPSTSVEGGPVDFAARARPVGLPRRAGGAHERAQARRAGAARACASATRPALELEVHDDGAGTGAPERRRRRPRPRRHARARRAVRRRLAGGPRDGGGLRVRARLPVERGDADDPRPPGRRPGARPRGLRDDPRRRAGHRGRRRGRGRRARPSSSARRAGARRRAHGHPHAAAGRHRGDPPDRRRAAARGRACSCSRRSTSTSTSTRPCAPAPAASCSRTCPPTSSSTAIRSSRGGEALLAPVDHAAAHRGVRAPAPAPARAPPRGSTS